MVEELPKKLTAEQIADLAAKTFGKPVDRISAPGGKTRESLRIHFADESIVATQRKRSGRMRMEIEVLKRLTEHGAPVPAYLGGNSQVFFQQDVGSIRLSGLIKQKQGDDQLALAEKAVISLLEIGKAADKANLASIVPALGENRDWLTGFVTTGNLVSQKYEFTEPKLDVDLVVDALMTPATRFIKWDARPGNGSVGKDGNVYWFDWEHCGKRKGIEDFAWLAGDEFWPLDAEEMVPILLRNLPSETAEDDITYLGQYVTFHIVQRLRLIFSRFIKSGWVNPAKAMKYDKIGTDLGLALRLCEHGAAWADRSPLTNPMTEWFENCATAIWELDDQPNEASA